MIDAISARSSEADSLSRRRGLAHVVPEARRRQNLEASAFRQNEPLSTPEVLTRHVRWTGLQVERDLPQDMLDR